MTVRKRAVCYISGFDPRGARHYYQLFKTELKNHSKLSGEEFEIGKRQKRGDQLYQWSCEKKGEAPVELDYYFLSHTDIITKHWTKTQAGLFLETWKCYIAMLKTRMFNTILTKYKPAIYSTSYPFVFGLVTVLLSLLVALCSGLILPFHSPYNWLIAILLGILALWIGKAIDAKFNHYWILRSMSYVLRCRYRDQPDLDTLKERMCSTISEIDQANDYDEILVIGHSYGAVLGVEIMSNLLEKDPEFGKRQASACYISLAGIVSFAHTNDADPEYKKSVHKLGTQNQIDWIDLGARADGACTSMLDPFYAANIQVPAPHYPRLFAVRFFKCYSKEEYKKIQKNKFEFHFQYLKTTEFMGEYNYFEILLGENSIEKLYPRSQEHPHQPARVSEESNDQAIYENT